LVEFFPFLLFVIFLKLLVLLLRLLLGSVLVKYNIHSQAVTGIDLYVEYDTFLPLIFIKSLILKLETFGINVVFKNDNIIDKILIIINKHHLDFFII
tara:strand:- start:5487 stop:5777 length:291 start_codon:yes stop_codon:yes gene_type:complete